MPSQDSQGSTSGRSERIWTTAITAKPTGINWNRLPSAQHFVASIVSENIQPTMIEYCKHKHRRAKDAKRCADKMIAVKLNLPYEQAKRDAVGQRPLFT